MRRATFSAFVTPMLFGSNSTKKSVIAVSSKAPHFSPFDPNNDAATWVKIVVASIEWDGIKLLDVQSQMG